VGDCVFIGVCLCLNAFGLVFVCDCACVGVCCCVSACVFYFVGG